MTKIRRRCHPARQKLRTFPWTEPPIKDTRNHHLFIRKSIIVSALSHCWLMRISVSSIFSPRLRMKQSINPKKRTNLKNQNILKTFNTIRKLKTLLNSAFTARIEQWAACWVLRLRQRWSVNWREGWWYTMYIIIRLGKITNITTKILKTTTTTTAATFYISVVPITSHHRMPTIMATTTSMAMRFKARTFALQRIRCRRRHPRNPNINNNQSTSPQRITTTSVVKEKMMKKRNIEIAVHWGYYGYYTL